MKIEEGKKYRIEFVEETDIDLYINESPNEVADERTYKKGDKDEVEIVEVDHDAKTATFYWAYHQSDDLDMFAPNVPLDSFKTTEVKVCEWVKA